MRRLMHLPRFRDAHPNLAVVDAVIAAATAVALSPIERFNATLDGLAASSVKLGALALGVSLFAVRLVEGWRRLSKVLARTEAAEVLAAGNAAEIESLKARTVEADAKAARAHAAAQDVAEQAAAEREAARKAIADAKAKVAAAVDVAKAAADAEIVRLKAEIDSMKKDVRHGFRNVDQQFQTERDLRRALTPDPDRPVTVIVGNDPDHPVPTVPQTPGDP